MEKTGKSSWLSPLVGIALFIGGVLALTNAPATFLTLAISLGILAIVHGIMMVLTDYQIRERTSFRAKFTPCFGLLLGIVGIIFLFRPAFAANIFAYIVAAWFIVDAINNLSSSGLFKSAGTAFYVSNIILNILLLACGIILIFNPLIAGLAISLMIGISLLIAGVEYMLFAFFSRGDSGLIQTADL